ncbi:hypothetical protein GPECTOR_2g1259 [Gonium pectorale]|uniref:Wax synthase domain-containing protein n=1 Tax=Gonium pectorale TaxID=33097 RepID=A0A150H0Q8_GONPE|nr:hypothetical protein GPECTOR_2g1259 [Gonium pectorale]|eukprot:KXZ55709.1 hypothetical protein GPECTOR_2g1259 [Gonium pectorale]
MLMWLANFKLTAFCLGRGPLTQTGLTLGQFTALLLWPIIPRTAFGVCAYCDLWANACAALVMWVHGVEVAPSWDRPWLQTSLADFWGRRWNLPASSSLKHLAYEPLVEDLAPAGLADGGSVVSTSNTASLAPDSNGVTPTAGTDADPTTARAQHEQGDKAPASRRSGRPSASSAARLAGLAATFMISGLMHEVLLCVCTGDTAQLGKQTLFFAIQAPLMLLEQQLVRAMKRTGVMPPNWICIPVASLTLQVPAMYWFWGAYFAAVAPRSSPLAPPPVPMPEALGTPAGARLLGSTPGAIEL